MPQITDALTVFGLLLDVLGALIIVAPESEYLDDLIGRTFWRTQHSYDKFSRIEYDHIILIEEGEITLPAFLVSVFDLDCKPGDITRIVKEEPGDNAILEIYWDGENSVGSYVTSYERAKDKVETTKQRRFLRRGAGLLVVGFGLQIVATLL